VEGPRSALLLGRDHPRLGAVAAVAEGPAAICLSRGGARKTYSHVEPNEDAVGFALGAGGALVAVADGHHGAGGSQLVLERLLADTARAWTAHASPRSTPAAWQEALVDLLLAANHAVLADAGQHGRPPAPTTLALALVRPAEDQLVFASAGDSHIFCVGADRAVSDLAAGDPEAPAWFLGQETATREGIETHCRLGCDPLAGRRALLLATDGLSERGIGVEDPAAATRAAFDAALVYAPELRALEACKALCHTAVAAQRAQRAGDNVGCAVLWLED